jgi:hypothetical protein
MMTSARRRFMGNADGHFPGDDGGVAKAAAIASPVALESSSPSWQPSEWRAFLLGAPGACFVVALSKTGKQLALRGLAGGVSIGSKDFFWMTPIWSLFLR